MNTPTCPACGTKFPGRDACKKCGWDLTTEVTHKTLIDAGLRKLPGTAGSKKRHRNRHGRKGVSK